MRINRRCMKCLLPDTFPEICFNENGICNQCVSFRKTKLHGEDRLLKLFPRNASGEYDCLVGISGGKDSCYVAYLAKEKYKLRVLAVCYDFPFLCDLARSNIQSVCKTLDIDLNVVKTKGNLEYDLLRNHMMSVCPTGTTWGQCLFCHYGIDAILYNVAKDKGIPIILGGVTKYELWDCGSRMKLLMQRVRKLPAADMIQFALYQTKAFKRLYEQRKQFPLPNCNRLDVYGKAKMPSDGPRGINVFEYVKWDQELMEKTLIEKAGWVKPDKLLSWRYDCSLEPFLDYTYKKEFGISTVGIYLSHLIRDGLISRDRALTLLEEAEDEQALKTRIDEVFEYLRLPSNVRTKFYSA